MNLNNLLAFLLILTSVNVSALNVTLKKPNVKVTIPELPNISMETHPLFDSKPHLRLMGSKDGYSASVITPTSDKGMTAIECASSRINSLINQFKLNKNQFRAMKGEDNNTFGFYFPITTEGAVQLNAYLLSSHSGIYCIEVHISKLSREIEDGIKWMEGFSEARITSY